MYSNYEVMKQLAGQRDRMRLVEAEANRLAAGGNRPLKLRARLKYGFRWLAARRQLVSHPAVQRVFKRKLA